METGANKATSVGKIENILLMDTYGFLLGYFANIIHLLQDNVLSPDEDEREHQVTKILNHFLLPSFTKTLSLAFFTQIHNHIH